MAEHGHSHGVGDHATPDSDGGAADATPHVTTAGEAVDHDASEKQAALLMLKQVLSERRTSVGNSPETAADVTRSPSLAPQAGPRTVLVPVAAPVAASVASASVGSRSPARGHHTHKHGEHGHVHAHAPGAQTWMQVDVTSPDAFQRVVMEGPEVLSAESKTACRLLTKALQLREKHAYRRPPYYMGALKPDDYLAFVPSSQPLPPRDEIGSPIGPRGAANLAAAVSFHSGGAAGGADMSAPASPASGGSAGGGAGSAHGGSPPKTMDPLMAAALGTGGLSPTSSGAGGKPVLVGDALVSQATGKTYPPGLFYRRRPEPPYKAFDLEIPDAAPYVTRVVNGVYHVHYAPTTGKEDGGAGEAAGGGGGRTPPGAPAVGMPGMGGGMGLMPTTSIGLDLDGLHGQTRPTPEEEDEVLGPSLFPVPSWAEWSRDYTELLSIVNSPPVRSYAYRRLQLLGMRFDMHRLMNRDREAAEQKAVPHRDFFNCRRVDTHVHHSACMNQKHLLRFIKSKLKKEADTVVIRRDGKDLTLAGVFQSLNLTAYDLSLDVLDMHADWSVAHRFDRFNTKYNPLGQSRLREIFLKTDNLIKGRFLAELTREVFDDLEATKYSMAEYRLSIYGRAKDEWRKLAAWVVTNKLSSPNVRWMIQIPRLYDSMRAAGQVASFGDMLANIFEPLFEVSINPSADPLLHQFLGQMGGFDSVDDESKTEPHFSISEMPPPEAWTYEEQPSYAYQTYYVSANLAVLNKLRRSRGMTEFSFRPHSGEAGSPDHLAATFLSAESIAHGINLRRAPVLEYLYYLAQIGIAVSPLSNNRLFLELSKSPYPSFFSRGLNVSLSTDDPLMLHLTREPLMEEYAVAMQVWHLSAADICEIARNSCLASCFEHPFLSHWLGPDYRLPGPDGNDISRTNVPHIRLQYRLETLQGEFSLLTRGNTAAPSPALGMIGRQTSSAAFMAGRAAAPQIVPHSPGSGRPLYRVVRRKSAGGELLPPALASVAGGAGDGSGMGASQAFTAHFATGRTGAAAKQQGEGAEGPAGAASGGGSGPTVGTAAGGGKHEPTRAHVFDGHGHGHGRTPLSPMAELKLDGNGH